MGAFQTGYFDAVIDKGTVLKTLMCVFFDLRASQLFGVLL